MLKPSSIFKERLAYLKACHASYDSVVLPAVRHRVQMRASHDCRKARVFPFQSDNQVSCRIHPWLKPQFLKISHECLPAFYIFRRVGHPGIGSILCCSALVQFLQTGEDSFQLDFHKTPPFCLISLANLYTCFFMNSNFLSILHIIDNFLTYCIGSKR